MKRHLVFIVALLGFSLACKTVQRVFIPPAYPSLPESTLQATPFSENGDVEACLNRLGTILETRTFDPIGNDIYESNEAEFNLVVYTVEGDEIKDPQVLYVPSEYRKYQEDIEGQKRIWDFYVDVIPAELRTMVKNMVIFTDNPMGVYSAWVRKINNDPGRWQVGFDLLDSRNPLFLADVVVHETAHLITLNASQVPLDKEQYYYFDGKRNVPECSQVVVDGGCSIPDSYINQFHQHFWKDIYMEWWKKESEAREAESDGAYLDVMKEFYRAHKDLFITSYAATNIKEDMAETFTAFVLEPRPTGDTIPEQKIAFFYEFPELVEYRQQIIEGVCAYVK